MGCGPQNIRSGRPSQQVTAYGIIKSALALTQMIMRLMVDAAAVAVLVFRPRLTTSAEILVLRRQLALFKERGVRPRRIDAATRVSLAMLSRLCDWRSCLTLVRPETVIRWHRAGWRLLWRYKSRPGRPPLPRIFAS
jgi:putative transposase